MMKIADKSDLCDRWWLQNQQPIRSRGSVESCNLEVFPLGLKTKGVLIIFNGRRVKQYFSKVAEISASLAVFSVRLLFLAQEIFSI